MSGVNTETTHALAAGLDQLGGPEIMTVLHDGQVAAAQAVASAISALDVGAGAMTDAIKSGGNLVYAAAGSSGLMALTRASTHSTMPASSG